MANSMEQKVFDTVDALFSDQIDFLKAIVACPSTLLNPEGGEYRMQQTVYRELRRAGFKTDMFEPDLSKIRFSPGFSSVEWSYRDRPQVVGIWESADKTGRSVALNGHADCVPAGSPYGWTYEPFKATIVGDRIYGRATADMKSGLSAMLYAMRAMKESGVKLKGDVYFQSVLEEECGGNGALACLERGYVGDGCICAETFGPELCAGYIGVVWIRMKVFGCPGHVLSNFSNISAYDKANYLIASLRELESKLNEPGAIHEAFREFSHPVNFGIGKVNGGVWTSSTMDEVTVEMRLSFYPGTPVEEFKKQVIAWLNKAVDADPFLREMRPQFTFPAMHFDGVVVPKDDPLVDTVRRAHKSLLGCEPKYTVTPGSADARFWPLYYGRPAICYGYECYNCHGYDEYAMIPSIKECTKVIAKAVMDWCGTV